MAMDPVQFEALKERLRTQKAQQATETPAPQKGAGLPQEQFEALRERLRAQKKPQGLFANIKKRAGGFISGLTKSFQERGEEVTKAVSAGVKGEESPISAGIQTAGEFAGAATDILGEAAKAVTPDFVKNSLTKGIKSFLESKNIFGTTNQELIKKFSDKYDEFKTAHPEAAKNLEAIANIGLLLPAGEGAKAGEKIIEEAESTGGRLFKRGAAGLESAAEKQSLRETIDVVTPELTKKERVAALSAGRGEETGIPGITRKGRIKPNAQDIEIAKSVEGIVGKRSGYIKNIDRIRSDIEINSVRRDAAVSEKNIIYSEGEMRNYLNSAKEKSRIIFGTDKTRERAYDSITNEFMRILKKHPKNLMGLIRAREEFDNIVKRKFPNVFDKFAGDDVRSNAIYDVRDSANEYVYDALPEDNPAKELTKKISNQYRAVKRISKNAEKYFDKSLWQKILLFAQHHPFISIGALSESGIAWHAGMNVLTNPILMGSLIAGGVIEGGKMVVTSQTMKNFLSAILEKAGKSLTDDEKSTITSLIKQLPGAAAGATPAKLFPSKTNGTQFRQRQYQ